MTTNSSINSDQSLKTTDSPTFGGMSINNSAGSGFAMTGNLPVLSTTNNGATNTQGVRTAFFKNRNGAAAQAGDAILRIQNNLLNSSLANVNVAEIGSFVLNANAGSEAGQFAWSTAVAGTLTSQLTLIQN